MEAQGPFSGYTVLLEDKGSVAIANKVKKHCRERYAVEYKEVPPQKSEPGKKQLSPERPPQKLPESKRLAKPIA